ncbi:MAG: tetratricopeptide repeat protein [Planctomycetota bacterium]
MNPKFKPGSSIGSSRTGGGIVSGGRTKSERTERPNKPAARTDVRINNKGTAGIGGFIRNNKRESRETEKPLERSRPQTRQEHRGANRHNRESRESGETVRNRHRRNIPDRKEEIVSRRVTDRISGEPSGKKPVLQNRREGRKVVVPKTDRRVVRDNVERTRRESVVVERSGGSRIHRKRGSSRVVYEDRYRTARGTHRDRHHHVYRNHRNRLCYRMISPRYRYPVYYHWGPWWRYRYVYPYYHRKYVFVSLGGYWPLGYTYLRYHWYPSHYYGWYGYYPIAREVEGDTYNYYTYNYYSSGAVGTDVGGIPTVDHDTFADIREKQQQQGPDSETLADTYFDAAVKAFEEGDYATAAERFADAMELAPEDMILPFAYLQALFANEKYSDAVGVLRLALAKVSPEEEGVFYARGLYEDETVLIEQIERLSEAAEAEPYNSDLQLLLGYHQLGIGETEKARESLEKASQDAENAAAAGVLLGLVEKIAAEQTDNTEQIAL